MHDDESGDRQLAGLSGRNEARIVGHTSGATWEWAVHLKGAVTACPAGLRRVDPQDQAITVELRDHSFWRAFDDGEVRSLAMSLATPEKIRRFKGSFIARRRRSRPFRFYLRRQDLPRRHPGACLRAGPDQRGCARGRMGRASRQWRRPGRGVARRHQQGPDCEDVSAGLAIEDRQRRAAGCIRRSGTEWCKLPPSCCWSRSSRRISTCIYGYRPRRAGPTRSRRACPAVSRLQPMWWTPICRSSFGVRSRSS